MCVFVVGYDGTGSEWEYLNADGVDLTSVSISFFPLNLVRFYAVAYVLFIYVIYFVFSGSLWG